MLIIGCDSIYAQDSVSFQTLIAETNSYLKSYGKVSAYGADNYSFVEVGLTEADVSELLLDTAYVEFITDDSIGSFDLIFFLQDKIVSNINRITSRKDFDQYDILELLESDELSIVKSEDGKLYNFSIDEKTGGTYRSRISWMYYTEAGLGETATVEQISEKELPILYTAFEGDGYSSIFTINTSSGILYVLTGGVRGCSMCFLTFIQLVHFENGQFMTDFYYSVDSRTWDSEIVYDEETKTIKVVYETDDLTPYCSCDEVFENQTDAYNYSDEEDSVSFKCHCLFEFTGSNFELVKQSSEQVKE